MMDARDLTLLDMHDDAIKYLARFLDLSAYRQMTLVSHRAHQLFQPLINYERLFGLTLWSRANLVKPLVEKDVDLAFKVAKVIDPVGNLFLCSPFQYAVWSFDMPMLKEMIASFSAEQCQSALRQIDLMSYEGFTNGSSTPALTNMIKKLNHYVDHYNDMDARHRSRYWVNEYGQAQRQCPASIVKLLCFATVSPLLHGCDYYHHHDAKDYAWFPLNVSKVGVSVAILLANDKFAVGLSSASLDAAQKDLEQLIILQTRLTQEMEEVKQMLAIKACELALSDLSLNK
jgi:hypothetical protein